MAPVLLKLLIDHLSSVSYKVHSSGIVLITGASTGIGRHSAEFLAKSHPDIHVLAGVRKSTDAQSILDSNFETYNS